MFGYLLVSNKNDVVLVDGDSSFRGYLWSRIEKEIHAPTSVQSTSSGVYTDSNNYVPAKKASRKASSVFSTREISHIFLPLISFYRGAEAAGKDAMQVIQSEEIQIRFRALRCNYLMICIGNDDRKQLSFLEYFDIGLKMNVGPLLELILTDLSPVKHGRENVQLLLERQCQGRIKQKQDFIDVRECCFYRSEVDKILPIVKSVCSQLHLFLGSNRCMLLYNGDMITSVNSCSEEKLLCNTLCRTDVRCLLDQMKLRSEVPTNGDISLVWLRSSKGHIPFYVNVIRFRLTDGLVLVCLAEAKHNLLIRLVVLLLAKLEEISKSNNITSDSREIGIAIEDITTHLLDMVTTKDSTQDPAETAFLRNPTKTAQFFKTVWTRLHAELLRSHEAVEPPTKRQRFSISSIKSAFSNLSINHSSSIYSLINNNGRVRKDIPLQLDVLLTYLRRQATTLLQELCSWALRDATQYKMNLFRESMRRILRPAHKTVINALDLGKSDMNLHRFLRPIDHRLNMLAYIYLNKERKLCLNYIPEGFTVELPLFGTTDISSSSCYDCTGISGERYTIYQLRTSKTKQSVTKSMLLGFRRGQVDYNKLPDDITLIVVFNSFVHKQLAFSQIVTLAHMLHRNATSVVKLLH